MTALELVNRDNLDAKYTITNAARKILEKTMKDYLSAALANDILLDFTKAIDKAKEEELAKILADG